MKIRDLVETARFPEDGAFHLHRRRHPTMKRLLSLFALALLLVACETQPVGVDTPDAQFAKGEKPDKPPKPVSGELITFTGDLAGDEVVEGCCPNAGPFPEYTMTFGETLPDEIAGEHAGNIFLNSFGRRADWDYIVQFWWEDEPDNGYFIEIRGGEKEYDNRTKILTVIFTEEVMTIIKPGGESTTAIVDFVLTRAPTG
jgi:hypothetical protein